MRLIGHPGWTSIVYESNDLFKSDPVDMGDKSPKEAHKKDVQNT
jgi:hypothetical protein